MCRRLCLSVRGSVIIKGVETEYSEVDVFMGSKGSKS